MQIELSWRLDDRRRAAGIVPGVARSACRGCAAGRARAARPGVARDGCPAVAFDSSGGAGGSRRPRRVVPQPATIAIPTSASFVIEKIVVVGVRHGSEGIVASETLLTLGRAYTEPQLRDGAAAGRAAAVRGERRALAAARQRARALRARGHGRRDEAGLLRRRPGCRVVEGRGTYPRRMGRRRQPRARRARLLRTEQRGQRHLRWLWSRSPMAAAASADGVLRRSPTVITTCSAATSWARCARAASGPARARSAPSWAFRSRGPASSRSSLARSTSGSEFAWSEEYGSYAWSRHGTDYGADLWWRRDTTDDPFAPRRGGRLRAGGVLDDGRHRRHLVPGSLAELVERARTPEGHWTARHADPRSERLAQGRALLARRPRSLAVGGAASHRRLALPRGGRRVPRRRARPTHDRGEPTASPGRPELELLGIIDPKRCGIDQCWWSFKTSLMTSEGRATWDPPKRSWSTRIRPSRPDSRPAARAPQRDPIPRDEPCGPCSASACGDAGARPLRAGVHAPPSLRARAPMRRLAGVLRARSCSRSAAEAAERADGRVRRGIARR